MAEEEAEPSRGCMGNLESKHLMRLALGGACLLALIFTSSAMGVPVWSYAEFTRFGRTTEVSVGLWTINVVRENGSDDDNKLKKNDLDKSSTYRSVEFNRAAVVMAFLLTFLSTVYYLGASWCVVLPIVDLAVGCVYLLFAIFAWAGAGSWGSGFEEEFDNSWDDSIPCAAGCGLEAWNGIMYLFIGVALVGLGVMGMQGAAPDESAAEQDRQPVPTAEAPAPAPIVVTATVVQPPPAPDKDTDKAASAPPTEAEDQA